MSRPLTPEQLAKREALKNRTTEEVYQDAVKRGLESNVAAERVAAIKAYADERNPGIIEMKDKVKIAEDRAAKAEAALSAITGERDTAYGVLCLATQSALQLTATKGELADLKANLDAWKAEQKKLLVAEAQQHQWDAERAERAAKETREAARQEFSKKGYEALLDAMRSLVERHKLSEPDIWSLPKNINPLFLTLWPGWTPIKAQYFVAFTQGYPEPNEGFRQMLIRCLTASLPSYGGIKPDPVENLGVRLEVLYMMCERWPGVLESAQRQVTEEQIHRQADFMRDRTYELAQQQTALAQRGYGRESLGVPQESETQTNPHFWNGFIPANPPIRPVFQEDDDINKVETIDYGQQLIEREALAKKGKIVTVLPPESVTLDGHQSLDDEGTL
jgi:hypothetical protein